MRARMRRPRCICSRCSAVCADDSFEDVATPFDGLFLSALFIPLLRVGLGGIADWPLRRRCRVSGVLRPVCGPGRASGIPRKGLHRCKWGRCSLMRQFCIGHDPARGLSDVKGLYTEWPRLQVADSGRFKAGTGGEPALQEENSEHYLRWACCRNLQVAGEERRMETSERVVDGEG